MTRREWALIGIAFGAGIVVAFAPAFAIAEATRSSDANVGAPAVEGAAPAPSVSVSPDAPITAGSPSAEPSGDGSGEVVVVPRTDALGGHAPTDLPEATLASPIESCPDATHVVDDAEALTDALAAASPGTVISLADGTYEGEFVVSGSGDPDAPIWVCGSDRAVLSGEGHRGGYGVHVDGARHVRLHGFTVTESQKGVMVDGGEDVVIESLSVHSIGDEAIHLRGHTTGSVVRGNTISDTGNRREKFGEGVYIGTAKSNWCTITDCEPDRSDGNLVEGNVIFDVTAEAIDIKEGTTGGFVRGNSFDGSSITEDGGDSWVDVKGNEWLIVDNAGAHSNNDGFQVHQILEGWGRGNVFEENTARVDGPGFGFSLTPVQDNVVACSNDVSEAQEGFSNVDCR